MRVKRVATPDKLTQNMRILLDWLDYQCFPNDDPYQKEGSYWWIAYQGGTPIAFAGLKPINKTDAFLCRVGVLDDYQGRGLQHHLIGVRERAAKELGFTWLFTYTLLNPPSIKSLLKSGYEIYEPANDYAGEALYFRKKL